MPKMGVNPEETKAPKPVPGGWYVLRVKALTAKLSASKKGYNYVAYTEITENTAENNGHFIPVQMNNGFNQAKTSNDFVHGLGFTLETDGSFPGDWKVKDPTKAADAIDYFDGAQYSGPLLGKTLRAELTVGNYNGLDNNEVKQIQCKLDGCATKFPDIRHLTDWRGKKN